jgi:hypothetical protein
MRRAYQEHRFGLVLGAGVSRAFRFHVPAWEELVASLASHPFVDGSKVDAAGAPLASRADLLFRHFTAKVKQALDADGPIDRYMAERIARGEWRALIREILYKEAPSPAALRDAHPFLQQFLTIVRDSPLTITYNFDAYLEMMLAVDSGNASDSRGRPYETVFDGARPFRSATGVIYHPNGYLPQNVLERASDDLVFSEEDFGDQLLASVAGHDASVTHHLSKQTCLFIGLSLSDETLRHLLRRNAVNNPGHFHYLVDWLNPDRPLTPERADALSAYRMRVYNLVTLYLADDEIRALGTLIQLPLEDFRRVADAAGAPLKYVFYLTGAPGVGKTTVLRHLASLNTYDEWMADPLPLLAKPYNKLSLDEQREVDDWVAKQLRDKNESLLREMEGVFVVERGPLDPLSFVDDDEVRRKATAFRPLLLPTKFDQLCAGSVILLWGDSARISSRVASRQAIQQPPGYLDGLQNRLRTRIYPEQAGAVSLRSTDWSISELVRAVAGVIHAGPYRSVDLGSRLSSLATGS